MSSLTVLFDVIQNGEQVGKRFDAYTVWHVAEFLSDRAHSLKFMNLSAAANSSRSTNSAKL